MTSGLDQSGIRRVNTAAALRALAVSAEAMTMTALAERTGLSRRTIELILVALVDAGWVAELDRVPLSGGAGRPPRRFELRAQHALLAAVRVNTLEGAAVVSDVRGNILGRARRALREYHDPRSTLDDAADLVREALVDAGGTVDRLRAGAVASGGAIDADGVVRRLVFTEHWAGVNLPAELGSRIGIPWFADNDANLGALAERWRGVARDHDDVVWAQLGSRAGLGILIRGAVHRGLEGAAGEIVEAASMRAGTLDDHPVAWLTSPVPSERTFARDRVAAAQAGDPAALAEVDEFVEHIVTILTTLSWTIAPSLIVLSGGMEDAADVLLPRVRERMRAARNPDIELRATSLGPDGPLIGALKFALDRMDTTLFGPVVHDA